jgi:hypothetical protein
MMSAGEGAILGKLVNPDGGSFDLSLVGEPGPSALRIQLMSPDRAVVATAGPTGGKPGFIFSHVKPGTYELSIYRTVPGVRTIAGSEPVTVDAGQVTPVTLTLQVTEGDEGTIR